MSPELPMNKPEITPPAHFLRQIVQADLQSGRPTLIATRFPPEPTGYLLFAHATSCCLNSGPAWDFGGVCHLRVDDARPAKEEQECIAAMKPEVQWLRFHGDGEVRYGSDCFVQL